MTLTLWIGGVFVVNLLLGIGLVAGVYNLMERQVAAGALGGIVLGTGLIYAEATLGERYFAVSVAEMKVLVIAAAVGATLGVVGTVLVFEPELETGL